MRRAGAATERPMVVALALLLAASWALRLWIVLRGGQGFWPDEERYLSMSLAAARSILGGHALDGARLLFSDPGHLGFKLLAVGPAVVQSWLHLENAWPAAFLALFSTGSIGLVWAIARRDGATATEAFLSALALACSNAWFYWARHLMPYDVALFWALLALWVGLSRAPGWRASMTVGALGFLAFATYNGYWTIAVGAFAIHALSALPAWDALVRRVAGMLAGFAAVFVALFAVGRALGFNLWNGYRAFASMITQGEFGEGYRVIGAYLWKTESLSLVLWCAAIALTVVAALAGRPLPRRAWIGLAGILFVLGSLVFTSDVLRKFVVYGRLVRQVVPFAALTVGYAIAGPRRGGAPHRAVPFAAGAALVAAAAVNFAPVLRQQFPKDFSRRADAFVAAHQRSIDPARVRYVMTHFIWPLPVPPNLPPHRDLLVALHPQQYQPYQYEGFTRAQREALSTVDVRMKLVALDP